MARRRATPAIFVAAVVVGVVLASLVPGGPAVAHSSNFVFRVDSTTDLHDADPGDGQCATAEGTCTLRAALEEADALPGGSIVTIDVPGGTYDLTLGDLEATADTVTVSGAGAGVTVVTAAGASRDLFVGAGATVTIEGMTFTGGDPGPNAYGGAIESAGVLTVDRSVITRNRAGAGGGLVNAGGTLVVASSVISDNNGTYYGGGGINNGGLFDRPGTVTIEDSSLVGNRAGGDGGGILNGQNGHPGTGPGPAVLPERGRSGPRRPATGLVLTVEDSTFTADASGNGGGALANDGGTTSVTGSTLDDNSAPGSIGGAVSSYGTLSVTRSTLNGNRSCYGGGIEIFTGGVSGAGATVRQSTLSDDHGCIGGALDVTGTVIVTRSTLSGNSAQSGAAMEIEGSSSFSLVNSTVTANVSQAGQGAVSTFECSSGTVSFVTFYGNSNALEVSCPDVSLTGSILSSSTDGANCVGGAAPVETTGYNLDSGTSCALHLPTDLSSTYPQLRPLSDNGGPTMTMALKAGSPAIDHGGTASTGCPATDQRGVPRPQGPACDIGAFEKRAAA